MTPAFPHYCTWCPTTSLVTCHILLLRGNSVREGTISLSSHLYLLTAPDPSLGSLPMLVEYSVG